MDIRQVYTTLQDLTERPSLLKDIAEGLLDNEAGLVGGEADDVDCFLESLVDLSHNTAEEIYDWTKGKSNSTRTIENIDEFLEDYEVFAEVVTVNSEELLAEIDNLVKLVKEARKVIEKNPTLFSAPDQTFYVYGHVDPSKKEFFYIGKGKGRRAWDKDRDSYWKKYVENIGGRYSVEILQDQLTEAEALEVEQDMLLRYKETVINKQRPVGFVIDIGETDA